MKVIRIGDRVVVREPGQPERHGVVTHRELFNDEFVYDITTDDGQRLLLYPGAFVELE